MDLHNLPASPAGIPLRGTPLAAASLVQVPAARTVSLSLALSVGAIDERDGEHGIAHLLEHFVFRGIESAPSSLELAHAIERLGGETNAWTDRENTCYWISVPRPHAAEAARLLGEIVRRPLLLERDFASERAVVIEEIRGALDDPEERASASLERACWGTGPMSRDITGTIAEVRKLTLASVRAFHRRHYRPERMSFSVAGDLTIGEASELAALVAPGGSATSLVLPRRPEAPFVEGRRRVLGAIRDGEQAQLQIGLPSVPREHPDAMAIEILAGVLGAGSGSRLFIEGREVRGIAYDISAGFDDYAHTGLLVVSASVEAKRLPEAARLIARELQRIGREPISEAEIERARGYLDGALIRVADDQDQLSEWYALSPLHYRAPFELESARTALAGVTPEQLGRVAAELTRGDLRIGACGPKRALADLHAAVRAGLV